MNSQQNRILAFASFFAFTSIIIGALGAHFLKGVLEPAQLVSVETAVRYQMYHALAMVLLALLYGKVRPTLIQAVFYIFGAGVICFSFSIYVFILLHSLSIDLPGVVHLITPLGGLLLMTGWVVLFFNSVKHLYLRNKDRNRNE